MLAHSPTRPWILLSLLEPQPGLDSTYIPSWPWWGGGVSGAQGRGRQGRPWGSSPHHCSAPQLCRFWSPPKVAEQKCLNLTLLPSPHSQPNVLGFSGDQTSWHHWALMFCILFSYIFNPPLALLWLKLHWLPKCLPSWQEILPSFLPSLLPSLPPTFLSLHFWLFREEGRESNRGALGKSPQDIASQECFQGGLVGCRGGSTGDDSSAALPGEQNSLSLLLCNSLWLYWLKSPQKATIWSLSPGLSQALALNTVFKCCPLSSKMGVLSSCPLVPLQMPFWGPSLGQCLLWPSPFAYCQLELVLIF